jgi:hypothetical protein
MRRSHERDRFLTSQSFGERSREPAAAHASSRAATGGKVVHDRRLPFRFVYRIGHLRPGGRKVHSAYVKEGSLAMLAETDETDAIGRAFRVRQRDRTGKWKVVTEVLCCREELWWPVMDRRERVGCEEFMQALSSGAATALAVLNCGAPVRREHYPYEELSALARGRIVENTREQVETMIRAVIADLRVFRGMLYVTGGEPVYICPTAPDGAPACVKVVKPPGRTSPYGPQGPLRAMASAQYDDLAVKGLVFSAAELELAKAAVADPPSHAPVLMTIEPNEGRSIATKALELQVRAAARRVLDSIPANAMAQVDDADLRSATRTLRFASGAGTAPQLALAIASFAHACARLPADPRSALDHARAAACAALEDIATNHRKRGLPAPFERDSNSVEEEEEALRRLVSDGI